MYLNALNIVSLNDLFFITALKEWRGSFEGAWNALVTFDFKREGLEKKEQEKAKMFREKAVELNPVTEYKKLAQNDTRLILSSEEDFPPSLRELSQPPLGLYIQGDLSSLFDMNFVLGIVGTRTYSAYGKMVCGRIIPEIVRGGVVVVSGLALGIDTFAHALTLARGGKTCAVLGGGFLRFYPPQNKKLAQDIVKQGGAVISEYHLATEPHKYNFPRRNRIVAGLSRAILVVEAPERSGSLITARYALEMNKDVLAVPGPINSPNSLGTNKLIKDGALVVTSPEDVLDYFGFTHTLDRNTEELDDQEKELLEKLDACGGIMQNDSLLGSYPREDVSRITSLLTQMELKDLIEIRGTNIIKK